MLKIKESVATVMSKLRDKKGQLASETAIQWCSLKSNLELKSISS